MITSPPGFLRQVRQITRECGVLLIADEVAVGMGRTGTLFACSQEEVVPDFLCLAKGLAAGYLPLAATLTTEEVFRAFLGAPQEGRAFYHGHTFTGNPLGAAAALANLQRLETAGVLEALPAKGERLRKMLLRIEELPCVGDVRQRGLMAGIELVQNRSSRQPFPAVRRVGNLVCRRAREHGVFLRPLGDFIVLMPPLAIPDSLLDRLGEVVYDCLHELTVQEWGCV
jgi:adenosylmethionine-8-amino-7-oxononanoate aminotransferase